MLTRPYTFRPILRCENWNQFVLPVGEYLWTVQLSLLLSTKKQIKTGGIEPTSSKAAMNAHRAHYVYTNKQAHCLQMSCNIMVLT